MSQLAPPPPNGAPGGLDPATRAEVERVLNDPEPLTQGYRPTLPMWAQWSTETIPQYYLMRDVELMMTHPIVRGVLDSFKSGVAGAEFYGGPDPTMPDNPQGKPVSQDPAVVAFVLDHCYRYWSRGVPKVQGGYEYGWIGCEVMYAESQGQLVWEDFVQFSPRDVYLLTQDYRPVGVRVKNVRETPDSSIKQLASEGKAGTGERDLWLATDDVPAKGVWYAHNPRYNQFFGQSQLLGAWRPWRRLAWKDGGETVADGGIYRFAYSGPIIKFPPEDAQAAPGTPGTTLDSQGRPRRFARDIARQIAEQFKAGAGVGISSEQYPQQMGGGDKWSVEIPKSTLNISGIIEYLAYLIDQIRFGIGSPPELFEASETGSGYSGRSIPLEGYLQLQQRIADALLDLFVKQILKPLVRWNFGPVPFDVRVRPLLESKRKQQQAGRPGANGAVTGTVPGVPNDPLAPPAVGTKDAGGLPPSPEMPGAGPFSLGRPEVTDRVWRIARHILHSSRTAA